MTIIDDAKAAAPLADRGGAIDFAALSRAGMIRNAVEFLGDQGFMVFAPEPDPITRVHQLEALLTQAQAAAREQRANEANKKGVQG